MNSIEQEEFDSWKTLALSRGRYINELDKQINILKDRIAVLDTAQIRLAVGLGESVTADEEVINIHKVCDGIIADLERYKLDKLRLDMLDKLPQSSRDFLFLKYDPLRAVNNFTAVGNEGRIGGDTKTFRQLIDNIFELCS